MRYGAWVGHGFDGYVGIEQRVARSAGRSVLARVAWEQLALPRLARRAGIDLLHGLAFSLPLAYSGPSVVTILDMSFALVPQHHPRWRRAYLSIITRASARKAKAIIAISECTRRDVVRLLGAPEAKVVVVPCGVGPEYRPSAAAEQESFRRRHGIGRYILYLGTIEPRKDLVRLVQAYAEVRRRGQKGHTLVLAGAPGWGYGDVYAEVERLGLVGNTVFTGYVPVAEAAGWYAAADLFVYPSVYEGFGLPTLEAMACGAPVIAADASSLPEAVGDAGVLVPPADTQALAEAMAALLGNEERRRALAARGLERARSFSWMDAAKATTALYSRCLA